MKARQLRFYLMAAAAMLLIPGTVLAVGSEPVLYEEPPTATESKSGTKTDISSDIAAAECYLVLDVSTGTVTEVAVRDYLIGVVCAEMPATFETEALKAQAVAAHTYAERISRQNREHPDPALFGADFSNDSNVYQAYYTEGQIRSAFGESFDLYYAKIASAVDAVCDEMLYYENEPIVAAFHAMSSGMTENAETVWGAPLAYLVSVDSSTDTAAPRYLENSTFTIDEVREILTQADAAVTFPEDCAEWLSVESVSDAGTVLTVQGGSRSWSGQQLREMFSLRSACFSVSYTEGIFTFTTKGFGHAVGMSQYGANAMAQAGCDYTEILAHYYPGTTLR